jgi:hypothetical protein
MSRIVKISNGDYKLQVQTGGNIILDTQSTSGTVTVLGNLDVRGNVSYVESVNTEIKDNIVQLNYGQTGNGISSANNYSSGIEVMRGNYSSAQFIFNEQLTHFDSTTGTTINGTWSARTANGTLNAIQLRTLVTDGTGNLTFDLQNSSVTLRIANSANYYQNVSNANDIPNLDYLQRYVYSNYAGGSGQGLAVVSSIQSPLAGTISTATSSIVAGATNIIFQVLQNTLVTIDLTGTKMGNIKIGAVATPNTITNSTSNNLILTSTNSVVELTGYVQLDDYAGTTPTSAVGMTKIWSNASVGPGKTGVYFVNNSNQTPDELISKNRAVLLSILL